MSPTETDRTAWEAAEDGRMTAMERDRLDIEYERIFGGEWLEAQRSDEESPGTTGLNQNTEPQRTYENQQ